MNSVRLVSGWAVTLGVCGLALACASDNVGSNGSAGSGGGIPCVADDVCQLACANDPDCAGSTTTAGTGGRAVRGTGGQADGGTGGGADGGTGGAADGGTGGAAESCDFAGAGGGPAAPLPPGQCCTEDDHCLSGHCVNGSCAFSAMNEPCIEDSDCIGQNCAAGLCGPGIKDTPCEQNEDCLSLRCQHTCQIGEVDDPCRTDTDCRQGNCDSETLNCAKARAGWELCESDGECLSGDCYNPTYTCFLGAVDTPCSVDTDCMSGSCTPDPDCATEPCNKHCDAPALVVETIKTSAPNDNSLDVQFRIENTGSDDVQMIDLTVFYFYTSESALDQVHHATVEIGNLDTADDIVSDFVTEFGGQLDYALRVSFTGSVVLAAGASTGEIYLQARTQPLVLYNQSNDFSQPVASDVSSWVGGEFNANPRSVLCRRISGVWQQVWGNSHPDYADPCGQL